MGIRDAAMSEKFLTVYLKVDEQVMPCGILVDDKTKTVLELWCAGIDGEANEYLKNVFEGQLWNESTNERLKEELYQWLGLKL